MIAANHCIGMCWLIGVAVVITFAAMVDVVFEANTFAFTGG